MLNPETQRKLQRIHRIVPKNLKRNVLSEVDVHAGYRDSLKELINDKGMRRHPKLARSLKKQLDDPRLYTKRLVENTPVAKKLDTWWGETMKAMVRRGDLPRATPDPQYRRIFERQGK